MALPDYSALRAQLANATSVVASITANIATTLATTDPNDFLSVIDDATITYETVTGILYVTGQLTAEEVQEWKADSERVKALSAQIASALLSMKTRLASVGQ